MRGTSQESWTTWVGCMVGHSQEKVNHSSWSYAIEERDHSSYAYIISYRGRWTTHPMLSYIIIGYHRGRWTTLPIHNVPIGEGELLTLWSHIAPRSTTGPHELLELNVQLKRDPHGRVLPRPQVSLGRLRTWPSPRASWVCQQLAHQCWCVGALLLPIVLYLG